MTLRTVEVYASYQGEGPNTGAPTTFVRFAGCNLKCPGWPCDTQHAIDPKLFTKTQTTWTDPRQLYELIISLGCHNVCFTGGEVFLQSSTDLITLTQLLKRNHRRVEVFTNGTLLPGNTMLDLVDSFILDWKLIGSGEDLLPLSLKHRQELLGILAHKDAIKFTIKNRTDFEEALLLYETYPRALPPVYCGVVWDAMQTEELCRWMMEKDLPWNLNVQVHKFVWSPDRIGV